MGDRANVFIPEARDKNGGGVWLYTHWGGYRLPQVVQAALRREARWDDPSYLTRIIFCEMVEGEEKRSTGFGISTFITDNSYPILVVDPEKQEVRFHEAPGWNDGSDQSKPGKQIGSAYSFGAFVTLPSNEAKWPEEG